MGVISWNFNHIIGALATVIHILEIKMPRPSHTIRPIEDVLNFEEFEDTKIPHALLVLFWLARCKAVRGNAFAEENEGSCSWLRPRYGSFPRTTPRLAPESQNLGTLSPPALQPSTTRLVSLGDFQEKYNAPVYNIYAVSLYSCGWRVVGLFCRTLIL